MCDCCDPTADSPDPVVVRLEAEVERWKLNVADAQGRIRELHDDNTIMRGLLREAVDECHVVDGVLVKGVLTHRHWHNGSRLQEDWFKEAIAALEGKP